MSKGYTKQFEGAPNDQLNLGQFEPQNKLY